MDKVKKKTVILRININFQLSVQISLRGHAIVKHYAEEFVCEYGKAGNRDTTPSKYIDWSSVLFSMNIFYESRTFTTKYGSTVVPRLPLLNNPTERSP
jgi:hypothetical protein